MHEEMEAETKRRDAEGATCENGTCGGYFLSGDPADFDRQRGIIDAARSGNFAPAIEDALDKYREDTSPDAPNYAPKDFWPSTGAFRSALYQAGQRLGSEAAMLLEQIPDDDIRLFATIELTAALAGAPASPITSMKDPRPPGSRRIEGRIIGTGAAWHYIARSLTVLVCEVLTAISFVVRSASSNHPTTSVGVANAVIFGIRSGRLESAPRAASSGKLPPAPTVAKYLSMAPGMSLNLKNG
jgi:hypothetical protein